MTSIAHLLLAVRSRPALEACVPSPLSPHCCCAESALANERAAERTGRLYEGRRRLSSQQRGAPRSELTRQPSRGPSSHARPELDHWKWVEVDGSRGERAVERRRRGA